MRVKNQCAHHMCSDNPAGRNLDDPPSPDTAKRGPGMFGIPEQHSPGPAWDFGRAQGRPEPDSGPQVGVSPMV
jgi:hypothetical protein